MARGDQLGRQWRILQTLLYSRQGLSVAQIAQDLEWHSRTVYRDLEALQIAGFPIYTDRTDGKNVWKILDDAKKPLPLPLDLSELTALYFSRRWVRFLKGTVFHDALESLFNKIKALLPRHADEYLNTMEKYFWIGRRPHKSSERLNDLLDQVNNALVDRKKMDIEYYTMSRRQRSRRRVAPYRLWFHNDSFYIIGFCEKRKDIRIFALDRIESARVSEERFEVPDGMDIDTIPRSSFGCLPAIRFMSKSVFQAPLQHTSRKESGTTPNVSGATGTVRSPSRPEWPESRISNSGS